MTARRIPRNVMAEARLIVAELIDHEINAASDLSIPLRELYTDAVVEEALRRLRAQMDPS